MLVDLASTNMYHTKYGSVRFIFSGGKNVEV